MKKLIFSEKAAKPWNSLINLTCCFVVMAQLSFAQNCPKWPPCGSTSSSCATAINLPLGPACVVGSNDAVAVANETDCDGNPVFGVFYKFTVATAGTYTVSTDNGVFSLGGDHVLKLYSDTCDSLIDCGDEEGDCNASAAQITADLAVGDYWVMVAMWNGGRGSFCVNIVANARVSNDCIIGATDIGTLIATTLDSCCSAVGEAYTYRPHRVNPNDERDAPSASVVNIGAGFTDNHCNGNILAVNNVIFDVWFRFTYNAATMNNRWLNVYPNNDCNFYGIQLFQDDPNVANNFACESTDPLVGLSYVDCSIGDKNPTTCGNQGAVRDKSKGNAPNHPTLDLSDLNSGSIYYLRVYQMTRLLVGNAQVIAPPSEGYFNLVIEHGPVTTNGVIRSVDGRSTDKCSNVNTVGCLDPDASDIDKTYTCLTNAGMTGNLIECPPNYVPLKEDEPVLVNFLPFVGTFQHNCVGTNFTPVGPFWVDNNSAIYRFVIPPALNLEADPACYAQVDIDFLDLGYIGVNGATGTYTVVSELCQRVPKKQGVLGGSPDWCDNSLCMDPSVTANNSFSHGTYYIIVNGDRDNILTYDLRINIDYKLLGSGSNCPVAFATGCGIPARMPNQSYSANLILNYIKPVPAVNEIEISYMPAEEGKAVVEIYDLLGKRVYAETMLAQPGENIKQIDISSLPAGTYILNLLSNGERVQSKLVKME